MTFSCNRWTSTRHYPTQLCLLQQRVVEDLISPTHRRSQKVHAPIRRCICPELQEFRLANLMLLGKMMCARFHELRQRLPVTSLTDHKTQKILVLKSLWREVLYTESTLLNVKTNLFAFSNRNASFNLREPQASSKITWYEIWLRPGVKKSFADVKFVVFIPYFNQSCWQKDYGIIFWKVIRRMIGNYRRSQRMWICLRRWRSLIDWLEELTDAWLKTSCSLHILPKSKLLFVEQISDNDIFKCVNVVLLWISEMNILWDARHSPSVPLKYGNSIYCNLIYDCKRSCRL